jgi:hemerythrin-like domain-containing protein
VLHYIDSFSYGIHHPIEEDYLFSAMRQSGSANHAVDLAMSAHGTGAKKFAALRAAFEAWRDIPDMRNSPFAELVADYVAFEFEHMSYEEYTLLPAAVDTLPAKDWVSIAEAFDGTDDPLFGSKPAPALAPLHFLVVVAPVSH